MATEITVQCGICEGRGKLGDECDCWSFLDTMAHNHEPDECWECGGTGWTLITVMELVE